MPFDAMLGGDSARVATLKQDVVHAGVRAVLGVDMPIAPKRRFQDGAHAAPRGRVTKAWCRRVFDELWEAQLREVGDRRPPFGQRDHGSRWSALGMSRGRVGPGTPGAETRPRSGPRLRQLLGRGGRRARRRRAHGGRLHHQPRVPLPLRDVRPVGQHARRDRAARASCRCRSAGAIETLPPARWVKLYNAGSAFDPRAIPPADDADIARAVAGFERVIVESHPAFLAGTHASRCLALPRRARRRAGGRGRPRDRAPRRARRG